jgi:hypothetical protein
MATDPGTVSAQTSQSKGMTGASFVARGAAVSASKRRHTRLRQVTPVLLLCLAVTGCDAAGDLWRRWVSGKPEVLDPRIIAGGVGQSAYWIDNERVIMMGLSEASYQEWHDGSQDQDLRGAIYIWNVAEDTVETFRDDVPVNWLCYHEGRVLWRTGQREPVGESEERYPYMAGPLEGPIERREKIVSTGDDQEWVVNQRECKFSKLPDVVGPKDSWEFLKEEHGYLYMDTPIPENNVRFYSEPSDEWVGLGDDFSQNARKFDPIWSPYQGAYFFRPGATHPSTRTKARRGDGCWHGWWLYPEGRLENACIPAGAWSDYGHDHMSPYRHGYLFVIRDTSEKVAGLYVSDTEGGYKLIGGLGKRPVVSPDGCRAVFIHQWGEYYPPTDSEDPYMFKAVTLCQGQDKGED